MTEQQFSPALRPFLYLGLLLFLFYSPFLNNIALSLTDNQPQARSLYKPPRGLTSANKTVSKKIEETAAEPNIAGLKAFAALVFTGESGVIRGVFVPDLFAYPIIQQPSGNNIYVSTKSDLVTQFRLADQNGVTGLLAHNYLSGQSFYDLEIGQRIWIVYGDGELRQYQVSSTSEFQKIAPTNLYSPLIDLSTQAERTTGEVYTQFYRGAHHLVFQTCLAGEGRLDWGLYFVMATPVED